MTEGHDTSRRRNTRARFAARFRELGSERGRAFADFVDGVDDRSGRVRCWGELARGFEEVFATEEAKVEALEVLVEQGESRTLLLLLDAARGRPELVELLLARADELPVTVQRSLVSSVDATTIPANALERLAPSARQLVEQGADAIARERELTEARIATLKAFGVFAADSIEPSREHEQGARE